MVIRVDHEHEELKALNLVLKSVCKKRVRLSSVTSALYCVLISQRHNQTSFSKTCIKYLLREVFSFYLNIFQGSYIFLRFLPPMFLIL